MSVFVPFRALGLISDDVPFSIQKRGKETFITVSVGNCWQVRSVNGRIMCGMRCSQTASLSCLVVVNIADI